MYDPNKEIQNAINKAKSEKIYPNVSINDIQEELLNNYNHEYSIETYEKQEGIKRKMTENGIIPY